MTLARLPLLLLCGSSLAIPSATADEVRPDEIQFRRQAVTRMVFDAAQNIPLSSLRPAQVVDLDLMHPELQPEPGIAWTFKDGGLAGEARETGGSSLRWIGGFNPFATYDLAIRNLQGDGSAGIKFLDSSDATALTASLQFKDGKPATIAWQVTTGGKQVIAKDWPVPPAPRPKI